MRCDVKCSEAPGGGWKVGGSKFGMDLLGSRGLLFWTPVGNLFTEFVGKQTVQGRVWERPFWGA